MRLSGMTVALAAAAVLLAGCSEVNDAVDNVNSVADKASVCTEALGLVDLLPWTDPEKVKERAADKEQRLRELAETVNDQDVAGSLTTIADSYVAVQQERVEDITQASDWVRNHLDRIDALRAACT
jgi:PBP1b-binding outer membrane lipoprotein LpoB